MQHEQEGGAGSTGHQYQGHGSEEGIEERDGQRVHWSAGGYPGIGFIEGRSGQAANEDWRSTEAQVASRERTSRNPAVLCDGQPWPGATAWTWIDRACWARNRPWDGEPDKVVWKHGPTGFDVMAMRGGAHGAWCGYVGVPKAHWAHGLGYDDVEQRFDKANESSGAHCGLTFAEHCADAEEGEDSIKMICHPTDDHGEDAKVWWLGFDCSHCDDVRPMDEAWMKGTILELRGMRMEYRTLPYVRQCCEELATNLAALT